MIFKENGRRKVFKFKIDIQPYKKVSPSNHAPIFNTKIYEIINLNKIIYLYLQRLEF